MEVSALTHAGVAGRHGRSPLLRLQTDERLIALIRRGNNHAFEALVSRYQSRLHAFCRHMLGSKEDAEDVLQEVFAAAFNAILADEREINVRPWLYRIARNRSLNHLRRVQPIGVDSMDVHLSEQGTTTADKAHKREEFRLLIEDVQGLPETQRTALLLREMEALSYEQISQAMETTVPSVKSLLVRARVSLAEAAEARQLSCEEVRLELGEVAEGLRKISPPVRRHVKACDRCTAFRKQLRETNKALAAALPIGPLVLVKKFALVHLGLGGSGAAAGAAGTAAAGSAAAAGAGAASGGLLAGSAATIATKAAAGLAAAALVTAGAVEVKDVTVSRHRASGDVAQRVAAPQSAPSATTSNASTGRRVAPQTHTRPLTRTVRDAGDHTDAPAEPAKLAAPPAEPPATAEQPPAGSSPPEPAASNPPKTQTSGDTTTLPPSTDTGSGAAAAPAPAPAPEPAPAQPPPDAAPAAVAEQPPPVPAQ